MYGPEINQFLQTKIVFSVGFFLREKKTGACQS